MEQYDCPACEAMRLAIVGYKAKTINELRRHLRLRNVPEQGGFPIGSMTKVQLIERLVGQDFPNDDVNDAMIDFIKAPTPICECYLECRADSHSGDWHTHEGLPVSCSSRCDDGGLMDEKTLNSCIDCQETFECTGEATYPDYGLHCTHDRCGACQHKWIFGKGIAFPNPIQISLGIDKSYQMPIEDKDGHKNDDPDWEAKYEEERLAAEIDPMTNEPYYTRGMPQPRRRDASSQ